MNLEPVGEPGVSAFLRSVLRNLGNITRMKPSYDTYLYYDPTQDLEKLRQKLVFFQGLVVDGEAKRLDDSGVDEWMDDVNDLVYDVEDIFDDIKCLRNDQVSVDYPVLLKKISDDVSSRFKKNLARAKKLGKKAKKLKLERVGGHAFRGESKVTLRTRETSSVVDKSEIHGREDDQTEIMKRLLEVDGVKGKKNYDVVCIVGMGGLGKTTLAQLVFDAPEVAKHFDVKGWVCISNVFDVKRATKELIENSGGGGVDQQSLDGLQTRLKEMVKNKRFLFVLDDVWSSSEWEDMKGPLCSCASGSKILITTRKFRIAQDLGNKDPYQLQQLNDEKCMEIFRDNAFGDDEGEQEKVDLVEKIVRACGGVPLVVKMIGCMLRVAADVEKWRAVLENTVSWAKKDDEIHPAIRFSYYDLPAYLKRCFEYLAVFPPDFTFKEVNLVSMWIANGLVEEKEGRMAEDIGAEYYNELKARSLIQQNNMMHDIVHHLATVVYRKICCKENSKEPPASVRHAFLVNPNAMHCDFLADQAPGLRTLIVKTLKRENVLGNTIRSCKMLRTLEMSVFFTKWNTLLVGESFIDHLAHLRYLTIHDSDIRHLLDSLCMLNNLQFLDLSRSTYLEKVLTEVNHLSNLRSLILAYSTISSLPESICHLSQLQVLNLEDCHNLIQLPKDIGTLRSLRSLILKHSSISSLPESICHLSQLQVLNLLCCPNLIQLPKDIGTLRSLRTLDIRYTSTLSVPESILNVTGLQDLLVDKHIELPRHIGRLARLKQLSYYHVGKEAGRGLGEINLMNILQGSLTICSMENIGSVEEAKMANLKSKKNVSIVEFEWSEPGNDEEMENIGGVEEAKMIDLKSKKNICGLEFGWSEPGNDEEMEVKIMEALEPHHALESLTFSNYGGDKFPAWIMHSNVCLSNLSCLRMEGLNKICEMIDMEFVSLEYLMIVNCPKLRKVIMVTPKLRGLYMSKCGGLEAASVYLLPSLSDKAGLHSILSKLEYLKCAYNIFEYFCEKLKTANSKWDRLRFIKLRGGGTRVASLPGGWPSLMVYLKWMYISKIEFGKFQFVPDGDQSAFPPFLHYLYINNRQIRKRLPHHWYTITSDGKVESEEESIRCGRDGDTESSAGVNFSSISL